MQPRWTRPTVASPRLLTTAGAPHGSAHAHPAKTPIWQRSWRKLDESELAVCGRRCRSSEPCSRNDH